MKWQSLIFSSQYWNNYNMLIFFLIIIINAKLYLFILIQRTLADPHDCYTPQKCYDVYVFHFVSLSWALLFVTKIILQQLLGNINTFQYLIFGCCCESWVLKQNLLRNTDVMALNIHKSALTHKHTHNTMSSLW